MPQDKKQASSISTTMLEPLIQALEPRTACVPCIGALPSPSLYIDHLRTVIAATAITTPPIFQAALVTTAWTFHVDVALVRHGDFPESLDMVEVDAVLGRDGPARIFWSYVPFRASDRGYWLVPPIGRSAHSLRLDRAGLTPISSPPYTDLDERAAGTARAARETILALRRRRP